MAEEKKKQFRKVSVNILVNGNIVGTEHYRIVVPPDSTTEKEIEWRLAYLKDDPEYSWQIESDELKKEV